VDFSNTVIIMTSNLGSEHLLTGIDEHSGELKAGVKERVMQEVRNFFRPEFLNRLDDIVMFHPLTAKDLSRIVLLQLGDLGKRLQERDILLDLKQSAADSVLKVAYNPAYGARPLRRYLEKHIVTQLSRMLISGELSDNCIVHIDAVPGAAPKTDAAGNAVAPLNFHVSARSPRPVPMEETDLRRKRTGDSSTPTSANKAPKTTSGGTAGRSNGSGTTSKAANGTGVGGSRKHKIPVDRPDKVELPEDDEDVDA